MGQNKKARHFVISGRVQGVGFRYFCSQAAKELGVSGWARNLDDGRVEVHANGTPAQLDDYESRLRMGPRFADVRSVEVQEAAVLNLSGFDIR
jgi:acylphosphatase